MAMIEGDEQWFVAGCLEIPVVHGVAPMKKREQT
jgi:hypothetical protein